MSWLSNTLGTSTPSAPSLPSYPTLTAPTLPQYPGFTQPQQQLLGQGQQNLTNFGNTLNASQNNPLQAGQAGINQQQMTNYSNALNGQIAPNQAIEQQKALNWQQTVEQAGQQGIRLSGDTPESAVSQSTAGNQIIQDFNKTYGALEQNYNLGQQQFLQGANATSLGLANQTLGAQTQASTAYGNLGTQLLQPYTQQQLGPYQQQTTQAITNTDIANQNLLGQYGQQTQQALANYQQQLQGQQSSLGLLNGISTVGGMLGAGYLANPNNKPQYIPYNPSSGVNANNYGVANTGNQLGLNPSNLASLAAFAS